MNLEEGFIANRLLSNLCSSVEITKSAISEFANLIEDNVEDEHVVKCFDAFVRLSTDYVTSLENISSQYIIDLHWLPSFLPIKSDKKAPEKNYPFYLFPSSEVGLQYADGHTPWSFWLVRGPSSDYDSLCAALQDEWQQGKLRKLSEPPFVGSYVICTDRNTIFRGIVLGVKSDKIIVRNIDVTFVKVLKLDNIYAMKRKFTTIYAKTVQCCLTKDDSLMNIWNSDLSELFKNTLKESNLKVSFIEECADCTPAKFLIELKASSSEAHVDFNSWICDKIFPELIKYQSCPEELCLEALSESAIDPYYVDDRTIVPFGLCERDKTPDYNEKSFMKMTNKLEITPGNSAWSSQLFMPPNSMLASYYLTPSDDPMFPINPVLTTPGAITAQYTTTTVYGGSTLDGKANMFPLPQQMMTTTSRFIVKPTDLSNTTLNVNTPVFEPRKKTDISITEMKQALVLESKPPNHTKNTTRACQNSIKVASRKENLTTDQVEICPMYNKNGFCLSSSCSKKHVKVMPQPAKENSNGQTQQSHDSQFTPSEKKSPNSSSKNTTRDTNGVDGMKIVNLLKDKASENEEEDIFEEDDDEVLEEPCIGGGYIPLDEVRLCRFPAKNGRCWKHNCNKQHEEVSKFKWTTDQISTVTKTFNYLDLPEISETIELVVTAVRNPCIFYARLPDVYSDIGEGVKDIETFCSLHKSLNDPRNIKNYMTMPGVEAGIGEMYLVRALDNYWKRALVLESSTKSVYVFYVDYGYKETVPEEALKLMEDRFNYLPAQAVLCFLSGLYCDNDDDLRKRGKKFLEDTIKGKVITGKVISRNIQETSLELLVTYKMWNINNVMVMKGFCEEIQNSSSLSMT